MGRGGCNCCGDWVTTAKISKSSGAMLWNYNYGLHTSSIAPINDNIYIFPSIIPYFRSTSARKRNLNSSNEYISYTTLPSSYYYDRFPFLKKISDYGKYIAKVKDYTFLPRSDWSNSYYGSYYFYASGKTETTKVANNRVVIIDTYNATIFEESIDSSKNSDINNTTDDNITLYPRYIISALYSNSFFRNGYLFNYSYYSYFGYQDRITSSKKLTISNANRFNEITDDYYVRIIEGEKAPYYREADSMTPYYYTISNIDTDSSNVVSFNIVGNIQHNDINIGEQGIYYDIINAGSYKVKINSISINDSSIVYRVGLNGFYIDVYGGGGNSISTPFGTYVDPIYSTFQVLSDYASSTSVDLRCSYTQTANMKQNSITGVRIYIMMTATVDVTFDRFDYTDFSYIDTVTRTFDYKNGGFIQTDGSRAFFAYGYYYNLSYSNIFKTSINLVNLNNGNTHSIEVNDILANSPFYSDLAYEYGFTRIYESDINSVTTHTISVPSVSSGVTFREYVLSDLGLSDGIIGAFITTKVYDSFNFGSSVDYQSNECLKVGHIKDNLYYVILDHIIYMHPVRYQVNFVSADPVDPTDLTAPRDMTVTVIAVAESPIIINKNIELQFYTDGTFKSYTDIQYKRPDRGIKNGRDYMGYRYDGMVRSFLNTLSSYGHAVSMYMSDRAYIDLARTENNIFILKDENSVRDSLLLTGAIHLQSMESYGTVGGFEHDSIAIGAGRYSRNIGSPQQSVNYANINYANCIVPISSDYANRYYDIESSSGYYTRIYFSKGADFYRALSNPNSNASQFNATSDIFNKTNEYISKSCNTISIFDNNGDIINGYFIPSPTCMTEDDGNNIYVAMSTTSNRIAAYTGIVQVPVNDADLSRLYQDYPSGRLPEYPKDVYQYIDAYNDWVDGIDTSRAYGSAECLWLIPDFNRATVDIENSTSVKVYIEDKYFELNLLDTADSIRTKVLDLGYSDIYVYGGPIADRAVCIAGFDSRRFENFVPSFATNDSLARFITHGQNNREDDWDGDYYGYYGYYRYDSNRDYYGYYGYDRTKDYYGDGAYGAYNGTYYYNGGAQYYSLPMPPTDVSNNYVSIDKDTSMSIMQHHRVSNRIHQLIVDDGLDNGEDSRRDYHTEYITRSGIYQDRIVSQDGFIIPAIKFLDDTGDKISYDFKIGTNEYISKLIHPELYDIDYLNRASGNMSVFFHTGLMFKVENSTTGIKSKQATIIKIDSYGDIAWTSEYGYKPFIQTKDSSGVSLATSIEKSVHFNGKIEDIKFHSGEIYITGNVINLDAIKPESFSNFSDYYSNVILKRFESEQEKTITAGESNEYAMGNPNSRYGGVRVRQNYSNYPDKYVYDVLGEYHPYQISNFKRIKDFDKR